ncbi:hypothetical protein B4168_2497 [Anoxybacillus flavithermus]|nr:hypothetical protein B4168_2497 [Anoxybacillus flavithermus]OAO85283.1 hypothetical protein GT23_2974 [Parageobacillus thermoglucosidasius]
MFRLPFIIYDDMMTMLSRNVLVLNFSILEKIMMILCQ